MELFLELGHHVFEWQRFTAIYLLQGETDTFDLFGRQYLLGLVRGMLIGFSV